MEDNMSEKYIITQKELHLGYIKETFYAGAVIEHDEVKHTLIIDGRKFNDTRDLDILKRQVERNPNNPWIVPFSESVLAEIKASVTPKVTSQKNVQLGKFMKTVQSDEDLMKEEIDIRDTQVSKKNASAKEASRQKVKKEGMVVVRGDESIEERLSSLKEKNDISSLSERVRLKSSGSVKIPVVKNDSLGSVVGSNAMPLNAGQPLPSRSEVEAKTDSAKALAAARKAEIEAKRGKVASEIEDGDIVSEDIETASNGGTSASVGVSENVERVPVTKAKQAKKVVG